MQFTTTQYFLIYGIFFLVSTTFALLISSLLLKFATNLGIRSNTEHLIRWSATTKPALGGFVFYILFLLSIVFYLIVFSEQSPLNNIEFLGLVIVCTLGFMMGMADDAYNTKPLLKFAVQFLCGVVLIATGTSITLTDRAYLDYPLTVIWVVGIMNSVNMLDNMDGVTGFTSVLIILAALVYLLLKDQLSSFYFVVLTGVMAGICGFLYYNWNPSKMYMGDTGSQFIGAFLAAVAIPLCWNSTDANGAEIQTKQVLSTLLFFIVPIADTTTVSINRLMRGQSPFVGGRDHTTHHLAYLGLKERHVTILLGCITVCSSAAALSFIYFAENWGWAGILAAAVFALIIIGGLYSTTKIKKKQNG